MGVANSVPPVAELYHFTAAPVAVKLEIVAGEQMVCVDTPVGGEVLFTFARTSKRVCDSQPLTVWVA